MVAVMAALTDCSYKYYHWDGKVCAGGAKCKDGDGFYIHAQLQLSKSKKASLYGSQKANKQQRFSKRET